ncbi:transposase family protein [Streptomyces sp. NBC_00289]
MCRQSATVGLVKSPSRRHCAIGPLAERLRALADPRCRRGKRHPFAAVLLIACSAVVIDATSFVTVSRWAAEAPQDVLARLGAHTATARLRHHRPDQPSGLPRTNRNDLGAHWVTENRLHFVRDIAFREDASTIRTGHSPENMATLRSFAINHPSTPHQHRRTPPRSPPPLRAATVPPRPQPTCTRDQRLLQSPWRPTWPNVSPESYPDARK